MAVNRRPGPDRRLPAGWALTLACDALATVLASLALSALGLLLPAITGDDGHTTGPTSPTALAFFSAAVVLVASLAVTSTLLSRAGTGRARPLALWLSAGRLGLLLLAVAAFAVYGTLTTGS